MRRFTLLGVALSLLFNIEFAFGRNRAETIELLRAEIPYPVTIGSLCEHIARIELEEYFPEPQFAIEVGIEYSNSPSQTLGELDVVVFEQSTHKAVLIAEVKCWKNLEDAEHKAKMQRARFKKYLRRGKNLDFVQTIHRSTHYSQIQFDEEVPFILISQRGGEEEGFDFTLEFTLDELRTIQDLLQNPS